MLRGFVNLMATDSESKIREKIGEAIRLKYPYRNNDFVFLPANRHKFYHTSDFSRIFLSTQTERQANLFL